MSWLTKIVSGISGTKQKRSEVPEGLWNRCSSCGAVLYKPELEKNANVCPKCSFHLPIPARRRLLTFFDQGSVNELGADIQPTDPLRFRDNQKYRERLVKAQRTTKEKDALIVMEGTLNKRAVTAAAFEFSFMGGSMGSVVGHKFVLGIENAVAKRTPYVCFTASGGARMQEGLISLFQMAKTSAAIARLGEERLPYISVLMQPTYGGVTASLALLGDINIAEPQAHIGFAGPRVIEQTVKQELPGGFQTSEFLLEHGGIDMIVSRQEMRSRVSSLINKLA